MTKSKFNVTNEELDPSDMLSWDVKEADKVLLTVTAPRITGHQLTDKTRRMLVEEASNHVGIAPVDAEMLEDFFMMYFELDTVEVAEAASVRLKASGFESIVQTGRQMLSDLAAFMKEQEREGADIGPIAVRTYGPDGSANAEMLDLDTFIQRYVHPN
jgi:hypothetical protein